jgi:hypothetical protein
VQLGDVVRGPGVLHHGNFGLDPVVLRHRGRIGLGGGGCGCPGSLFIQTRQKNLGVRQSQIHKWGVCAEEEISPQELVVEYVGEAIYAQVAERLKRRLTWHAERESSYA